MIVDDVMTNQITLHGLGFIQVQLPNNQRLHVWHPELPRRRCFEHSSIHDHRFSFRSRVLVGTQVDIGYRHYPAEESGEYVMYLHEGARTARGGRPWVPDGRCDLIQDYRRAIEAGNEYRIRAYVYHRTEPGGNGKVATLMYKSEEFRKGSHSTCRIGIHPDADFDRYQWSPSRLWEVVSDVLLAPVGETKCAR
ncbi:hypothetical protein [Cupriavidus basilensis]|uniref:hypothetical protein n=1 Tax=Cupriavidus basilensis TaxID=68895 RepID=UPI0007508FD9|nr:hypothetical protein [Cupriavidus basilensis]